MVPIQQCMHRQPMLDRLATMLDARQHWWLNDPTLHPTLHSTNVGQTMLDRLNTMLDDPTTDVG